MGERKAARTTVFGPVPIREWRRVRSILGQEAVGGFLLLAATASALVAANSGLSGTYVRVRDAYLGADLAGLQLRMSVGHWAADGLLVVFFFLVGLELKREFVAGELRDLSTALVPVAAAFGGVALPALIYAAGNAGDAEALTGWAIPAATDIAFALAVLAVIGSHLPSALRTFLLTLAVVDDLIAIAIIAVFYTSEVHLGYLLAALVPLVAYGYVVRRYRGLVAASGWAAWVFLLPLGVICWAFVYNSGVHATIAGVMLAFTVPVRPRLGAAGAEPEAADHVPAVGQPVSAAVEALGDSSGAGSVDDPRDSGPPDGSAARGVGADGSAGEEDSPAGLADVLEHRFRPLSAGVCVPVFAFFSAGVAVGGWSGLRDALGSPVTLGVIVALLAGKTIGIAGSTFLVTRLRQANLHEDVAWIDVVGLSVLAGMGFTVSLLLTELSFAPGSAFVDEGKIGVLAGSVLAAVLAAALLAARNAHYRRHEPRE